MHSPSMLMQLYALKGLYIFAKLLFQCSYVVHFVSCFCGLPYTIVSVTLSARGLAHSGTSKSNLFRRTNIGATGDPQNVIFEYELMKRHALVGLRNTKTTRLVKHTLQIRQNNSLF